MQPIMTPIENNATQYGLLQNHSSAVSMLFFLPLFFLVQNSHEIK